MRHETADRGLVAFVVFTMTVIFGTVFHFLYDLSGGNKIIALFSAVNESTWEHLKLLFFSFIILSFIEYLYIGKQYKGYWTIKAESAILGMIAIVVFFYTYTGIIGNNFATADISIFIIGSLIASFYSYKFMDKEQKNNASGIIIISVITLMFIIFTFNPPHIALFLDPATKTYGIDMMS